MWPQHLSDSQKDELLLKEVWNVYFFQFYKKEDVAFEGGVASVHIILTEGGVALHLPVLQKED